MRAMKWGKGTVTCGLCSAAGHNIRSCPHYEEILKEAQYAAERKKEGFTVANAPTYKFYPWQHARAMWEKKKRDNRKKSKPKSTKPRKCSFCKLTDHTKRNCSLKKSSKEELYAANAIWRDAFANQANQVGLGPGALIKIKRFQSYSSTSMGWRVYKDVMSLVTAADWDELTFMNSYGLHWQYQSLWSVDHHLAHSDDDIKVRIGQPELKQFFGKLLYADQNRHNAVQGIEIINKAEVNLDDKWIHNKQVKELDWLIDQHSLAELEGELAIIPWARKIIKNGICL